MTLRPNDYDKNGDIIPDSVREETQGERAERALAIIDRLRTDRHINNKEQGTLRRAILLPERPQGDLISREALKRAISEATYNFEQIPIRVDKVQEIIDNAPTVDIKDEIAGAYNEGYMCGNKEAEKARPKGEWRVRHDNHFRCTNCEQYSSFNYEFCPNCGADMRGGAE